jgi:Phage integrase family
VFTTKIGTAVDPRNARWAISAAAKALGINDVGLHKLKHAARMLAAGVPLHTVSELLGHSSVAVTGGVYGHPPPRACLPPSNGSQEQWAGENVCRCYTVATRKQRGRLGFCPKRPLTCCFPSG